MRLIDLIAQKTGLDVSYLSRISKTSKFRYRTYGIKKKKPKNESDVRLISQPSQKIKYLQKIISQVILCKLKVHKSIYSYSKGKNIVQHANLHKKNKYLMRIDFEDFFPSILREDIERLLQHSQLDLLKEDIDFICDSVCFNGALTIGAPSSPIISNAILYDFDNYWYEYSLKKKIQYSRYADDIYFSTNLPNILDQHYNEFCLHIKNMESPRLRVNTKKTIFTSKKRRRVVTGIILTSENKISIGREHKRTIKALVHQYLKGSLNDTNEIRSLSGYLNFAQMVEPDFILSLRTKYGEECIARLINI